MLLQSLVKHYEMLQPANERIPAFGFEEVKVSYALILSNQGELLAVMPLKVQGNDPKKQEAIKLILPQQVKRAANISPNFLCDNSGYVLGLDIKGKPERARQCFEAFRKLHHDILDDMENEETQAVLNFLDLWVVPQDIPAIFIDYMDDISKGANFVFRIFGKQSYVHENEVIKSKWLKYLITLVSSQEQLCLVTGERTSISRLHPSIKGIYGGQSMGSSLISYNDNAYESYGYDGLQGMNASVGEYATFAYGTMLNHLLAQRKHQLRLGDSTIVFWADSRQQVYSDLISSMMDFQDDEQGMIQLEGQSEDPLASEIKSIFNQIRNGIRPQLSDRFDGSTPFYIVGLSPNAARVSIRFFQQSSFGNFFNMIVKHYEDLRIETQFPKERDNFSIWRLLNETVSPKSKDKSASPLLAGVVMRSILTGMPYPSLLFQSVMLRIKAEKKINYYKASIIKAYLIRCDKVNEYKEVLTMSLNETSKNKAYLLGRLFAALERAQQDANSNITTTITDRYFTSASTNPANVFPTLLKLSRHHISKAKYGYISDKLIGSILASIDIESNPFPKNMSLQDQGIFVLGYYHQKNAMFKKGGQENERSNQE